MQREQQPPVFCFTQKLDKFLSLHIRRLPRFRCFILFPCTSSLKRGPHYNNILKAKTNAHHFTDKPKKWKYLPKISEHYSNTCIIWMKYWILSPCFLMSRLSDAFESSLLRNKDINLFKGTLDEQVSRHSLTRTVSANILQEI